MESGSDSNLSCPVQEWDQNKVRTQNPDPAM